MFAAYVVVLLVVFVAGGYFGYSTGARVKAEVLADYARLKNLVASSAANKAQSVAKKP